MASPSGGRFFRNHEPRNRSARSAPARLRECAFRAQTVRSRHSGIREVSPPIPGDCRGGQRLFLARGMLSRAQPYIERAHRLPESADQYGESEFAGPAAYGVAEIAFKERDYAGALPFFHRSAAKSREAAVALSARYFEARCLEDLDRKEEAANIYLQVAEAGIRTRTAKTRDGQQDRFSSRVDAKPMRSTSTKLSRAKPKSQL